jgi:hypothetical protein
MVRMFATMAGLMAAAFVLVFGTVFLVHFPTVVTESATFWSFTSSIVAVGVGTMLAFSFARFMTLAYGVRLVRGHGAVGWCSPQSCRAVSFWLSYDWNFYGKGGRHRGERLMGLAIALEGTLA